MVLDLSRSFVKLGHRCIVVSRGGGLVKESERMHVKHYCLPVDKKSLFTILKMIFSVRKIIKDEKIDVVHAHSRVPAWIAFFACCGSQAVFLTTCHGHYNRHYFSRVMSWAKLTICPSQAVARHMRDGFGLPLERIRLIHNGVDLDRFKYRGPRKRGEDFIIGIIGRLSPSKGHIYFLRAVARLLRRTNLPQIKVWIVGEASSKYAAYKQELKRLTKRLGLGAHIEFLGLRSDIPQILEKLNLLIVSSTVQEVFARIVIEAQAVGVPVVATRVGGIPEIIDDHQTGLLVTPADAEDLFEAMLRIIKDSSLASRLAENAYLKLKDNFNIRIITEKTLAVYKEAVSSFKILVIKLTALGDVILIGPALRAIRRRFPRSRYKVSVLVNRPNHEVLLNCPYVDELIITDLDKNTRKRLLFQEIQKIRKKNFDLSVDFQNNRISHLASFLGLIPQRYGYNRRLGFLLNHGINEKKERSYRPVEHQFRVLKELDIELENEHLELWPDVCDEEYIKDFLNSHWVSPEQTLVGINLGASQRWQTKIWPNQYLVELCHKLASQGIRVVFTGGSDDLPRAQAINKAIEKSKSIIACGKTTINQLACLIKRCRLYLTSDSAPLHIACAVDTPYIALFGPTDPRRHIASGHKGIVLKKELPCQPCYRSKCKRRECMYAIKPEEVMEAIKGLLVNSNSKMTY